MRIYAHAQLICMIYHDKLIFEKVDRTSQLYIRQVGLVSSALQLAGCTTICMSYDMIIERTVLLWAGLAIGCRQQHNHTTSRPLASVHACAQPYACRSAVRTRSARAEMFFVSDDAACQPFSILQAATSSAYVGPTSLQTSVAAAALTPRLSALDLFRSSPLICMLNR